MTVLLLALLYETGGQFDVCTQPTCKMTPNGFVNANTSQGLVFTGAPRNVARTCEVCHTDAPRRIGLRVESDDPSLFTVGWQPSRTYHMRVVMTGEWAGIDNAANDQMCGDPNAPGGYKPCDDNGFSLEIDDGTGTPITMTDGKFQYFTNGQCTDQRNAETYIMADQSAIAHGVTHARTIWDFCWVAPQQDHGPLVLYVAAVDGNGGDGTTDNINDTLGDDVFAGSVPLPEQGMGTLVPQNGACAMAGRGAAGGGILLLVVFALVFRRGRILALLALLAGGCTTVRPWQKEQLARRIMKFAPDPDEDELDLHMLEAREGSTGGYGSAGGGCGCN